MAERCATGLWCEAGVPHKGWACTGVEDLEDNLTTCMMCQTAEIRFAHSMQHDNYAETLVVGCICAEHMSEGYDGKAAEREVRARSRRKNRWCDIEWKPSTSGTSVYHRTKDDFVVIVYWKKFWNTWSKEVERTGFGACIKDLSLKEERRTHDCRSEETAKEAARVVLEEMRAERETPYIVNDPSDDVPEPEEYGDGDQCEVCDRVTELSTVCQQCGRAIGSCCLSPNFQACRECVEIYELEGQALQEE
jgi:hypothetical protein